MRGWVLEIQSEGTWTAALAGMPSLLFWDLRFLGPYIPDVVHFCSALGKVEVELLESGKECTLGTLVDARRV